MLNNIKKVQIKSLIEDDWMYLRTCSSAVYQLWVRVENKLVSLRREAMNLSVVAFAFVVALYMLFPTIANADMELSDLSFDESTIAIIIDSMINESEDYGVLPIAETADPRTTYTIPLTAYTSDPAQTDDTPCITASGLDVCERGIENVVAANFLPMGTRVRIPELYGDRVFYVEDRMNRRYEYKMDVWMLDINDARQFGLQFATVEVF
jgi:3D (Asp-Asp-Asp) domain-containing protein